MLLLKLLTSEFVNLFLHGLHYGRVTIPNARNSHATSCIDNLSPILEGEVDSLPANRNRGLMRRGQQKSRTWVVFVRCRRKSRPPVIGCRGHACSLRLGHVGHSSLLWRIRVVSGLVSDASMQCLDAQTRARSWTEVVDSPNLSQRPMAGKHENA